MRHGPVRRSSRGPGCRRILIGVLLLSVMVTACLLLGLGSGMLAGKLALPDGLSLGGSSRQVNRGEHAPSAPPVADAVPDASPAQEDVASAPTSVLPAPLEASELPAGEAPPVEEERQTAPELPSDEQTPSQDGESPPTETEATTEAAPAAANPLPGLPASAPTTPATRLLIPSLGVDAAVVLLPLRDGTWDISQLTLDVGHLQGTASPGENSNVALAGHITLAQGGYGPFKDLALLQTGDEIQVYAGSQSYRYVVEAVNVVAPQDVEITYPTDRPLLTLITCANWDRDSQRYLDRVAAVAGLAD